MNKVILCGRLTRDPDVRQGGSDGTMTIARFTLAVDRWRGKSGDQEASADFISCIGFGKRAEFLEKYCHKGYRLIVQGKLRTRTYTTQDGEKATTSYVLCDRIEIERSTENDTRRTTTQPREERSQNDSDWLKEVTIDAEDLPF